MLTLLATTLLAAAPAPVVVTRAELRWQLDAGGMVGSVWYLPETRAHLEDALAESRGLWRTTTGIDARTFAYAAPVVGSFLAATDANNALTRGLLMTSGVLQALGLAVFSYRWFIESPSPIVHTGPTLSVSPLAAGGLGLSVRLTGW